MGGTFDPIHYGHLILADQACDQLDLEKTLFVTSANPPHKISEDITGVEHRHEMVRLAIEEDANFELSDIELRRLGASYTIDTLRELKARYGEETELYLLLGADEARDFMAWRDPFGIAELARICVANRPGHSVDEAVAVLPDELAGQVVRLEIPGVDVSSTDIRGRVGEGRSIRYLTPRAVEVYILRTGLYRGSR